MKNFKKDIIIYFGSCIFSIILLLILSHRPFAEDLKYRIRASDISIIQYASFIFIIPLLLKLILKKIYPLKDYKIIFNTLFVLALLNPIIAIAIILSPTSVMPAEYNYALDKSSMLYILYRICKISTYLSIGIVFLFSIIKVIQKMKSRTT